jgi:hypothetical protein
MRIATIPLDRNLAGVLKGKVMNWRQEFWKRFPLFYRKNYRMQCLSQFLSEKIYCFWLWSLVRHFFNAFSPTMVPVPCSLLRQLSRRGTSTIPIFIRLLKKSIGSIGFRFVSLDSFMLVVSVILSRSFQACY